MGAQVYDINGAGRVAQVTSVDNSVRRIDYSTPLTPPGGALAFAEPLAPAVCFAMGTFASAVPAGAAIGRGTT